MQENIWLILFLISSVVLLLLSSPISAAPSLSNHKSPWEPSIVTSQPPHSRPEVPAISIFINRKEESSTQSVIQNVKRRFGRNKDFTLPQNQGQNKQPAFSSRNVDDNDASYHIWRQNNYFEATTLPWQPITTTVENTLKPAVFGITSSIKLRIKPGNGRSYLTTVATAAPKYIGDECHVSEQCQDLDPSSTCELPYGYVTRCMCPSHMFVATNRSACITKPKAIEDACAMTYHCEREIARTHCDDVTDTCRCVAGYFADHNKTVCHEEPKYLGDHCQEDVHCAKTINMSKCESDNSTCVCQYGYTHDTEGTCKERPDIPPYKPFAPPTPAVCHKQCKNWNNSLCIKQMGVATELCRCDYRHARRYNSTDCVPVQTYELTLDLVEEAGKYDYVPLQYRLQYKSARLPAFQRFAERVTLNGMMKLFESTSFKKRYVSSEVKSIQNLDETRNTRDKGVKVTVLLHLTADYLNATSLPDIYKVMEEQLDSSDGELGESRLRVAMPVAAAVTFSDYDECAMPERHDCSIHAICINTLGSFMCVCKSRYEDHSKSLGLRPGRECVTPSTTDDNSDLCSSEDCETKWEFVALALTLFLLILLSFIVYEIIQHKKSFTARKLYEKFGTTKIRKLRLASMRRIQEAKKRKKEENKKKKEDLKRTKSEKRKKKQEEKKRKGSQKKKHKTSPENDEADAESDEGSVEMFDAREKSPTPPVEIMHPPSHPFSVTSSESPVCSYDASSLPGSVNTPLMETQRRMVSPIEESPV